MAKNSGRKCDDKVSSESLGYFMGRAALQMEQIAPRWAAESKSRSIRYVNTEMVFPTNYDLRLPNFVDTAHLSDLGQKRLAEYFAGFILEAGLNVPFDVGNFAKSTRAEAVKAGGTLGK